MSAGRILCCQAAAPRMTRFYCQQKDLEPALDERDSRRRLNANMAAIAATLSAIDPNDSSKNTFKLENASTPLVPRAKC